jgi:magnesium chelatase family protein
MAGEPGHSCKRGIRCAQDYQARLSGPFLDRIDLRIEVPAVSASDLIGRQRSEASAAVAARVKRARDIQSARYHEIGAAHATNAAAGNSAIEVVADPDQAGARLLREAAEAMRFSARAYHRILKVARTIADLDGADAVGRIHVAEAIAYRMPTEQLATAA